MVKPLLTFYGGKQRLCSKILPLIPITRCYVEPFFGGGTIFFQKEKHSHSDSTEVINDVNHNLIAFYRYAQSNPDELINRIKETLYAEKNFLKAKEILLNTNNFDDLDRAWAVFTAYRMSFCQKKDNFSFGSSKNLSKHYFNYINKYLQQACLRLQNAQILCRDALQIIDMFDCEYTTFYCDPPYYNADHSPYKVSYTKDDFSNLIKKLTDVKGLAIVSCYPNNVIDRQFWDIIEIDATMSSTRNKTGNKIRTEWVCLLKRTYPLSQNTLFDLSEYS